MLPETKPLPVTVRVKSPSPAGVEAGANVLATGVPTRLLPSVMLLVNNRKPVVGGSKVAKVHMAKPFPPQRTICVPEKGVPSPQEPSTRDAVCANEA